MPEDDAEMRRLPLFARVSPARIDSLLRGAVVENFPAQATVVREGEMPRFLHLVLEGSLEMFASHRGREASLAVIGPGRSFILAAVLLDRPYLKSVRVLEATRILMIPAASIRAGFAEDLGLARTLGEELALSYRGMVKELKNQTLRKRLERLSNWLLAQDAQSGGTGRFTLPFEKKVLASRLGMAPEVLSRAFVSLAASGVAVRGATITFEDRAALRALARPCATIDDATF